MHGLNFIKDMSREDLIEEVVTASRENMSKMDDRTLRRYVMETRIDAYRKRLFQEAGFTFDVDGEVDLG